ncbi:MAG: hypothetical protein INQ03_07055 [Candidatus Heimdallarchaeota archaeon]|nr:hypothetical protein [Candidatus Heimdallarchaeota archaeon]
MRIQFIFLAILLIAGTYNPIQSLHSNNMSMKINNEKIEQPKHNISEHLSYSSSNMTILENQYNTEIYYSNLHNGSEMEIEILNGSKNLLKFEEIKKNLGNSSIGDFSTQVQDKALHLYNSMVIYDLKAEYILNNDLSGFETLSINVEHNKWMLQNTDIAFNLILLKFNTLNIYLLLDYSEYTLHLFQNTTTELVLLDHSINKLNLSAIVEELNLTKPSMINSIVWRSYNTNAYNYSVKINSFLLEQNYYDYSVEINNNVYDGQQAFRIPLELDNYRIIIPMDHNYLISINELKYGEFNLPLNQDIVDNYINLHLILDKDKLPKNYITTIYLPTNAINASYIILAEKFNTTKEIILTKVLDCEIFFSIELSNTEIELNEIVQGEQYHIQIPTNSIKYAYISNKLEIIYPTINNTGLVFQIPSIWDKGHVDIVIARYNYNYTRIIHKLLLNPSKIPEIENQKIDYKRDSIIPIYIRNLSSGIEYTPDQIVSFYDNNSIRAIQVKLLILAAEFPIGQSNLTLLINKQGLVQQRISITINIANEIPIVKINSKRVSSNIVNFYIFIPEIIHWQIEKIVVISSKNSKYNYSIVNENSSILIYEEKWSNDELLFNISLILGESVFELEKDYKVSSMAEIYQTDSSDENSSILIAIASISTSTGIFAINSYRKYVRSKSKIIF